MNNKIEYVSAIIRSSEGDIILQLRDNNPAIADPNCLSLFAGAMEEGETKEKALQREIKEETELDASEAEFLFSYEFGDRVSHVYFVDGIDVRDIVVHEGKGYRTIRDKHDLETFKFAPISKRILQRWLT